MAWQKCIDVYNNDSYSVELQVCYNISYKWYNSVSFGLQLGGNAQVRLLVYNDDQCTNQFQK